ncbi:MAG: sugar transporter [Pseudomonadota bacterium]
MALPVDALAGIGSIARTSSSDTDILFEFIQSPEIVGRIDETLDLRAAYSRPGTDFVFAFDPDASNEKLFRYWQRMVAVHYDPSTGLIELEVRAFSQRDAFEIATEILAQSSAMINQLSAISRDDRTRYAREELDTSVERLKQARRSLTAFRATTQIVDPTADVQGQMTVLVSLQQKLAGTYVELDLLSQTSRADDPRVVNLQREVDVIERRIEIERKKFGLGGNDDDTFTAVLARFEELNVDLEFAQTSYLTALTTYEAAIRDAQQQSRYLATYLQPTLPDSAEHPQRLTLIAIVALFSFLIWSVICLIYYSARDRG